VSTHLAGFATVLPASSTCPPPPKTPSRFWQQTGLRARRELSADSYGSRSGGHMPSMSHVVNGYPNLVLLLPLAQLIRLCCKWGSKPCIRYSLSLKSLDYNLAGTYRLPTSALPTSQHHNRKESTSHRININITARISISPHHITSASHHKQPAAQASPLLVAGCGIEFGTSCTLSENRTTRQGSQFQCRIAKTRGGNEELVGFGLGWPR